MKLVIDGYGKSFIKRTIRFEVNVFAEAFKKKRNEVDLKST